MRRPGSRGFSLFVAGCLVACGGGTPAAETATGRAHATAVHPAAQASVDSSDDAPSTPAPPKAATCDDGTCSPCGDAICPSGWYCDESAQGGPACGWLPECAKTAGCACIKKAFAGCVCEEKNGAAHLSCR